jgi:hypothetical protein
MKFVLAKWRANMFGEWDSMHKGTFERLLLVASERDSCDSVRCMHIFDEVDR